jgi:enterobacteria phage integrase
MAPRPRSYLRRALPPNLYERDGYYSYRNPLDGREYGLGRDRRDAIQQAIEVNLTLAGKLSRPRLIDRVSTAAEEMLEAWLDVFERKLKARDRKPATVKQHKSLLRAIRRAMGGLVLARIETRDAAQFLGTYADAGKRRMAQALRSMLLDVFNGAIAEGWIKHNPITVTNLPAPKVQRARLTLEAFLAIYEAAGKFDAWVQNSMALALVSGQRREEIAGVQFSDIRDGAWWCEQAKEGTRLVIPVSLRLDAVGWTLEDVFRRCRDTVVSHYVIHHTKRRTKSKPGEQVWIDTITKGFERARRRSGLTWPAEKTPPTFHEIRSLAERLYAAQGNVNTQELLGHRDPRSTATYHDARGEWIRVKVA